MRRHALQRLLRAAAHEARAACSSSSTTTSSSSSSSVRGLSALACQAAERAQPWAPPPRQQQGQGCAASVGGVAARGQQQRGMFIQTQPTPNPSSLMFIPGQAVLESGSRNFSGAREGMASPLAKRLFQIDGVTQVFFGSDFVTVTKSEDYAWAVLKPDVFAAIMDHYASGEPLFYDEASEEHAAHAIHEDDDEIVAMIKELLETRIRPAVQEDGGDIVFRTFDPDSGVVTLKMMGACSGCPSSAVTLKGGIENMLMHYIPEVKGVIEAEPDEHEDEGLKAFSKLEQHLSN